MALIFFSNKYDAMYNCSFYNYEDIFYKDRSNLFCGWLYILTAAVIWILYIPCILIMFKKDLFKHSCYKLMICHGIFDLNFSIYTGFWSGIIEITGNVYCHWPKIAFVMGFLHAGAWKAQSTTTILLAFNRCIDMFSKNCAKKLFDGKRTYLWMIIPILSALQDILWGPVAIFSPVHSVLTYNPHEGYVSNEMDGNKYSNNFIFYYNLFVGIFIVFIYGALGIYIFANSKTPRTAGRNAKVFGQILLISLFLVIAMTLFVITQFYQLPLFLYPWFSYLYLLLCGLPAVIYLTLNKTIRSNVLKMFRNK